MEEIKIAEAEHAHIMKQNGFTEIKGYWFRKPKMLFK
jgi:hypothetical protein